MCTGLNNSYVKDLGRCSGYRQCHFLKDRQTDLPLTVTGRDVVLLKQQMADSVQDLSLESHFLQQLPPRWAEVGHSYHLRNHYVHLLDFNK